MDAAVSDIDYRVRTGAGRGSATQRGVTVGPVAQTRAPVTERRADDQSRRVRHAARALSAASRLLLRNAPVAFWNGYVHRCRHDVSDQHQDQLYFHHFNQFGPASGPGLSSALPVSAHLRVRIQVLRSGLDLNYHLVHPGEYKLQPRTEQIAMWL